MSDKNVLRCLDCVHGSITTIGSLRCAHRYKVLSMNPRMLLPAKSNGTIRGFRVRKLIDDCAAFREKP
jgi:hypothetical protein